MNETFKTQNGSLQLTEQGAAIRYSKYQKVYLVVLSVVYAVWGPLKIRQYIENREYQDLIIAIMVVLCFIASLYCLLSLSRNRVFEYSTIRSVTIRKGSIIDRVVIRFELNSGKRKRIYIDYNEYNLRSITAIFEKEGIEVAAKWKTY